MGDKGESGTNLLAAAAWAGGRRDSRSGEIGETRGSTATRLADVHCSSASLFFSVTPDVFSFFLYNKREIKNYKIALF
jgi:hypothetical protein